MGRECSELSEFRNVFDCHSFTHGRRAVTQAKSSPIPDVSAFQFHEGHLAEARPPSASVREGLRNPDMSGTLSLSVVAVSHFACLQARDCLCKPWHSVIAGDASKR